MPRVHRCFAKLTHQEKDIKKTAAVWYTRKGDKVKSEKTIKNNPKNEHYNVKSFTHKEFDIPSGKAGLVEFLNKYCKR